jgi:hypothetical protein
LLIVIPTRPSLHPRHPVLFHVDAASAAVLQCLQEVRLIVNNEATAAVGLAHSGPTAATGDIDFHPRTPLGQRLWRLRQPALAEGERLLDWDDLEREVATRRGGSEDAG